MARWTCRQDDTLAVDDATTARRGLALVLGVIACIALTTGSVASAHVAGAATRASGAHADGLARALGARGPDGLISSAGSGADRGRASTMQPHQSGSNPVCTFNGASDFVYNVSPGSSISIVCSGWEDNDTIGAGEFSPLFFESGDPGYIDNNVQIFRADSAGNLNATFQVPSPFTAAASDAVCPPTPSQVAEGFLLCGLVLANEDGSEGVVVALVYSGQAAPLPVTNTTAVGMAATPDGGGYWIAWANGDVTVHGDAESYGNASTFNLNQPITHIVATSDGKGYWLVAADGGTFAFGDAGFYGSMGGQPLDKPVVDIAPTADDKGYWLVAGDGGIFAFGDAQFRGSMGGQPLNQPVVGIAGDNATGGYWMVAADGGIFSFNAPFFGSTGSLVLNKPVNGMATTTNDGGYRFVASDGGIFSFGDAAFYGSTGGLALNAPIVGMSTDPATDGYWLVGADGGIFAFNAPFYGAA
jgi:hypothetical protein